MGIYDVSPASGLRSSSSLYGAYVSSSSRLARHPSPFFDYASMSLPTDADSLLQWCAYFALKNPVINGALVRKSLYPITPMVFRHPDQRIQTKWNRYANQQLHLTRVRLTLNLFAYTFGRAALSVFPPFKKYFICKGCGRRYVAQAVEYKLDAAAKTFYVRCSACGGFKPAEARDVILAYPGGFSLRLWGPREVIKETHGITGQATYYISPAIWFRAEVKRGLRRAIVDTPQEIIEACLNGQCLRVRPGRLFVLEEPGSIPPWDTTGPSGWPFGSLMSVLPEAYHYQIAAKNEEVQWVTGMIPFRGLAPVLTGQPGTDTLISGAVAQWSDMVRREYKRFLTNPGYMAVFPVPVQPLQTQSPPAPILPHAETDLLLSRILAGIRWPKVFVLSGGNWSSSTPEMKLLEAEGKLNQDAHLELGDFIVEETCRYLDWPRPSEIKARPLVSADALQRLASWSGMTAQGQVSRQTLHEEQLGLDHEEEETRIDEENRRFASRQIESQRMMQEAQASAAASAGGIPPGAAGQEDLQQLGAEQPQPGATQQQGQGPAEQSQQLTGSYGGGFESLQQIPQAGVPPELLHQVTQSLQFQSPLQRAIFLRQAGMRNPAFGLALQRGLGMPATDERPLPEQLPPRRERTVA